MEDGYEVITFNSSKAVKTQDEQAALRKDFLERSYGDFRFVHVNAPEYSGNGVKRMISIWKFAAMIKKNAGRFPKPDIVLHNIHPPFDYPIVGMAKKLGAKYIAEAWDLWPEDFVTFGLVKPGNPMMKLAYAIEKRYYYKADEIVFTFLGAFDYLRRQGWMKDQGGKIDSTHLHYINNGVDLEQFDKDKSDFPRDDEDMNNPNLKKVVYLGSINRANNVKTLIDAASMMQDNPAYRFCIYGDGAYRNELERYVEENGISNVIFKEKHISFPECAWVVSQATVNVMNYEKGFGMWGVSSGKMFQYLAAGKPIVCNVDIAYDNFIEDNDCGVARDINSAEEFAATIRSIAEQSPENYAAMCARARDVAKKFDYKVLAEAELNVLKQLEN